jgi:hypothetical protein
MGPSTPPTNDIPTPPNFSNSPSSTTTTSPPSVCAYQSFATAACPATSDEPGASTAAQSGTGLGSARRQSQQSGGH